MWLDSALIFTPLPVRQRSDGQAWDVVQRRPVGNIPGITPPVIITQNIPLLSLPWQQGGSWVEMRFIDIWYKIEVRCEISLRIVNNAGVTVSVGTQSVLSRDSRLQCWCSVSRSNLATSLRSCHQHHFRSTAFLAQLLAWPALRTYNTIWWSLLLLTTLSRYQTQ